MYVSMRVYSSQRLTSYIIPQKLFLFPVVGSLIGIEDSLVWPLNSRHSPASVSSALVLEAHMTTLGFCVSAGDPIQFLMLAR